MELRYEVTEIVHRISFINIFYEYTINGSYARQRNNFNLLIETATEDELIKLTSHQNGVIRCYSFKGLLKIESNRVKEAYQKLKNDSAVIAYTYGCIADKKSVSFAVTKMYAHKPLRIIYKKDSNKLHKIASWLKHWFRKRECPKTKMSITN